MSGTFKLAAAGLGVVLIAALAFALYYGRPTSPAGSPAHASLTPETAPPSAAAAAPSVEPTAPSMSPSSRPPSFSAEPSPSAVPSRSAEAPAPSLLPGETIVAENFRLPFEYTVPDGIELNPTTASTTMYALTEGSSKTYPGLWMTPVENTRGITVAFTRDATTHSDLNNSPDITLRPDSFFDDLRKNPSLDVRPAAATLVSGLPAEEAEVRARIGGPGAYPDIHLEGQADNSLLLLQIGFPGTLTVIRADGGVLLVHVWAADADEWETWLPVARSIVGSIKFLATP